MSVAKRSPLVMVFILHFFSGLLPDAVAQERKGPKESQPPLKLHIRGSLSPEGMQRLGKPMSVVNKEKLEKSHGSNIADILQTVPGVASSSFGPGASRPIIRGQGKERVRVIENGLENGDVSATSDDHAVTNNPLTSERVDILRGPSTLLYGSQAIGGVVNIIDDSIAEEPVGKELRGKATLAAGDSASDERSGAAVLTGQVDDLQWHVSAFKRESGDIQVPRDAVSPHAAEQDMHNEDDHDEHEKEHGEDAEHTNTLANSYTDNSEIKFGLSKIWQQGFWGVAVRRSDSDYGIPGAHAHDHAHEVEPPTHTDDPFDAQEHADHDDAEVRIDLEQTRVETRGELHFHKAYLDTLHVGAAYSDYAHKELEGAETGTIFERDAFELRLFGAHRHDEVFEGGVGVQLNYDDFLAAGAEAFLPATKTFSPAFFMVEDFSLSKNWIFQLGGRYEYTTVDPANASNENFNALSSAIGVLWQDSAKWYSSALSLSYSERAPNSSELFADGAHIASQTYEIGDDTLDGEQSLGVELNIQKTKGRVRGGLTGFVQHYNDYINLQAQGFEKEGFHVYEYAMTEARFWGFEAEGEFDLLQSGEHLLTLLAGFDYVRGRDLNASSNLPRITPIRSNVGFEYRYDIFKTYANLMIVEDQDHVAQFEETTPGYHMLTLGASVELARNSDFPIELYIRGTNITDQNARVHTSFQKEQAPLRGRAFFAGITSHF